MVLKAPVHLTDHIQGDINAPLVLVEYGDYQCPYCGEAYPVVKELQEKYGAQLAFVFRNFPLVTMHPQAEPAAEAAEAANVQGKFWQMHDLLYQNQDELGLPLYTRLGELLGFDMLRYEHDIASHAYLEKIKDDIKGGMLSGVNGTPTFYINGKQYSGNTDLISMSAALDAALVEKV